jgi:hypothetical protein
MASPDDHGGHIKLRQRLLRCNKFLYSLYKQKNKSKARRIILTATHGEINALLRIVGCIEKGHIELSRSDYNKLYKGRHIKHIVFLSKKGIRPLLKTPLHIKRKWATKMATAFKLLLKPLYT